MPRGTDVAGIKALDRSEIAALVAELGQPAFRAGQLERWLYGRTVRSFADMSDLPAGLRETLTSRLALPYPEIIDRQASKDGTRKYLLRLAGGATIETVGLPAGDRLTVCFSTQAGCPMQCAFCATGIGGLV
ncbi:MAG TPA: hypothetical protein VIK32_00845, partial [Candidatus Limnocylindrales bacterium]